MWKTVLIFLLAAATFCAAETATTLAGDLTQQVLQTAKTNRSKAAVLFFVTTDCPISNRYAPEINRICRDYEKRGAAFFIIQVGKTLTEKSADNHKREFGFTCPVLIDRTHKLVKLCGAKVTPEAAIVSPQGKLLYCGRIDDSYARWGQMRAQPGKRDLRVALDAVLAGQPVPVASTVAIGCYIEDAS